MKATNASIWDLRLAASPRQLFGSKKDNGRVTIIGGSADYYGAPLLASNAAYNTLAALRIGTGYATLYVPKALLDVARKLSPTLIVMPFGSKNIGEGKIRSIIPVLEKTDSLVIGMGIGREKNTLKTASAIISYAIKRKKKVIIDADAVYSVKYLKKLDKNVILTPQDREFSELYGRMPEKYSLQKRIKAATSLATKLDCCVLLKGHQTVITNGKSAKIVSSRSSALATMGTGDVLAGIIGGYAATGTDSFKSAIAGAYLHSLIGDLLYKEKGNHIISSDLVEKIPPLLKKFDRTADP